MTEHDVDLLPIPTNMQHDDCEQTDLKSRTVIQQNIHYVVRHHKYPTITCHHALRLQGADVPVGLLELDMV